MASVKFLNAVTERRPEAPDSCCGLSSVGGTPYMRRSYDVQEAGAPPPAPAELLLVPMIDIFTVLVTFLLMTAVFSRTVVLQLDLPTASATAAGSAARTCSWRCWCATTCSRWPTATPGR